MKFICAAVLVVVICAASAVAQDAAITNARMIVGDGTAIERARDESGFMVCTPPDYEAGP